MFSEADFNTAAAELAQLNGISAELAADYLARIGDTPELAEEDAHAIVRDDTGAEIARVRLPA